MVVCLERGADDAVPPTVSCFSKIQIGFTFLVLANLGSPGQRAVKRVCVCVCISVVGAMMTEAHEHLTSCTIDCVQLNIHSCGTVLALHVCLMVNLRLNILCLIFVGVAF